MNKRTRVPQKVYADRSRVHLVQDTFCRDSMSAKWKCERVAWDTSEHSLGLKDTVPGPRN